MTPRRKIIAAVGALALLVLGFGLLVWPGIGRRSDEAAPVSSTPPPSSSEPTTAAPGSTSALPSTTVPPNATPSTVPPPNSPPPQPPPAPPGARSPGWMVTVYYTAVESFHTDARQRVRGCPVLECADGKADLGSYPASFVKAVHDEGTGRITAGPQAGRYLNWSEDVGYWLDDAPRDSEGRALEPFVSAAADAGVLNQGQRFQIVECGRSDEDTAVAAPVCQRLSAGNWQIKDRFTSRLGGKGHVDVYLGEETGPGFTDSPLYTTLHGATLAIQPG